MFLQQYHSHYNLRSSKPFEGFLYHGNQGEGAGHQAKPGKNISIMFSDAITCNTWVASSTGKPHLLQSPATAISESPSKD